MGSKRLIPLIAVPLFITIILSFHGGIVLKANRFDPSSYRAQVEYRQLSNSTEKARFAYAFIISGCSDQSCMGYILNILVASQILQEYKSDADIVFKVQMADGYSRLSDQLETWLSSANIKLQYMNSTGINNFGLASLLKFRILQMLEYKRVLFLDSDIIPLCNMDYMFQESYRDDSLLQDNVVVSGAVSPATASMFLLTPEQGEFERIINLVREYRRTHNGSLIFDHDNGWGQKIVPPDKWEAYWMRKDGYHWDYHGANADQGLLYHWIRYMKMNYSQIRPTRIETWREVTHDPAYWNTTTTTTNTSNSSLVIPVGEKLLAKTNEIDSRLLPTCGGHLRYFERNEYDYAPYCDHVHFAGGTKPWNEPIRVQDIPTTLDGIRVRGKQNRRLIWLYHLGKANETFNLGLDSIIEVAKGNPFGGGPRDFHVLDPAVELPMRRRRKH